MKPGRIGPGGRCANREGIPPRQVSATTRSPPPIGYIVPHVFPIQSTFYSPPQAPRQPEALQCLLAVSLARWNNFRRMMKAVLSAPPTLRAVLIASSFSSSGSA